MGIGLCVSNRPPYDINEYDRFIGGIITLVFSLLFLAINISKIVINARIFKGFVQSTSKINVGLVFFENLIFFANVITCFISNENHTPDQVVLLFSIIFYNLNLINFFKFFVLFLAVMRALCSCTHEATFLINILKQVQITPRYDLPDNK